MATRYQSIGMRQFSLTLKFQRPGPNADEGAGDLFFSIYATKYNLTSQGFPALIFLEGASLDSWM